MELMRAVRLHIPTRTLRVEEVPRPEPGPGQILVKVEAAGVCLSDVHLIDGTLTPVFLKSDSVTLGHEVSGTVAELGPGVVRRQPGERVVVHAGEERDGMVCTLGVDYDGGWAEYVLVTEDGLVTLPETIPFEQGAIIPDAVSTPWGAVTDTGRVRPGEAAGVWGVGGLGTHAVQLLRLAGACPVVAVDPRPAARERAVAIGADLALDPADPQLPRRIREVTGGLGLPVAFDFAGVHAVREQVAGVLAKEGRLVLAGLTDAPLTIPDGTRFSYLRQRVLGHYGSDMRTALPALLTLIRHGRLDLSRSVSDVLPLAEAARAVERLERKEGDPIRLILRP